jgi:hypothetical protein
MGADRAVSAGAGECWSPAQDRSAPAGRGDLVHGLDRLPVARHPEGISALFDGAGIFLRLVAAGIAGANQPHVGHGVARKGVSAGSSPVSVRRVLFCM